MTYEIISYKLGAIYPTQSYRPGITNDFLASVAESWIDGVYDTIETEQLAIDNFQESEALWRTFSGDRKRAGNVITYEMLSKYIKENSFS